MSFLLCLCKYLLRRQATTTVVHRTQDTHDALHHLVNEPLPRYPHFIIRTFGACGIKCIIWSATPGGCGWVILHGQPPTGRGSDFACGRRLGRFLQRPDSCPRQAVPCIDCFVNQDASLDLQQLVLELPHSQPVAAGSCYIAHTGAGFSQKADQHVRFYAFFFLVVDLGAWQGHA